MIRLRRILFTLQYCIGFVCFLGLSACALADEQRINIAVASNFKPTLQRLITSYQTTHPQQQISVSAASTGVLYQQIIHGAPFDLFLSADSERPTLLAKQGFADSDSLATYASGVLALWTPKHRIEKIEDISGLGRIAIANPKIAPYGLAAQQTMQSYKLWNPSKIAKANNVAQVLTYVEQGYADAGFIPLSYIKLHQIQSFILVPKERYKPILQQMVLTKYAQNNQAAKDFYQFMLSGAGLVIIEQAGYQTDNLTTSTSMPTVQSKLKEAEH